MSISIEEALAAGASLQTVSDSWRLDVELLLAEVLGKSREHLYTWPSESLGTDQERNFRDFLDRRLAGEPVAYLLGRKAFWDFELQVDSRVLIPRPETECLVEQALQIGKTFSDASPRVADLGTGSGAIAIALARGNPLWLVTAVDISADALELASLNAAQLGAENIEFRHGSWCDGLEADEYAMIVANPPYVAEGDRHLQQGDLPFEPAIALVASDSGLGDLSRIIQQGKRVLKKDAWLLLEHGFDQQDRLRTLLANEGFKNVVGHKDYANTDRLVCAQWPG